MWYYEFNSAITEKIDSRLYIFRFYVTKFYAGKTRRAYDKIVKNSEFVRLFEILEIHFMVERGIHRKVWNPNGGE